MGKAVRISGFDSVDQVPLISLASCDSETTMPAIGMTLEDVANGEDIINIRITGIVSGFDTSQVLTNSNVFVGFNGDISFVDPIEINSSYVSQQLGTVIRLAEFPNGQIEVFPLEVNRKISHSSLSDLDHDDHTIYSLVDGARAFTGVVSGVDPVSSQNLATKNYVDGYVESNTILKLASVVADLNVGTKQTIYTVPNEKKLIVVKIIAREPSSILSASTAWSYGRNATANDWKGTAVTYGAAFTAATNIYVTTFPGSAFGNVMGAAGDIFGIKVTVTESNPITITIDLFGYLV